MLYGQQRKYMLQSRDGQTCGNRTKRPLSTAGNATWTALQTAAPLLERDTNGASRTDTTATAAQLVTFSSKNASLYEQGFAWETEVYNISSVAGRVLTVSAGAGITLIGEGVIGGTSFDLNPNRGAHITWRITNNVSGSEAVTAYVNGTLATGSLAEVTTITSATTLTASNVGQRIMIGPSAGAFAITLPAPVAGIAYRFQVVGSLASGAVTISSVTNGSTAANVTGIVGNADGTAVGGTGFTTGVFSGKTNLVLGTGAVIGDIYEYTATGTGTSGAYTVWGLTGLHTSVTAT